MNFISTILILSYRTIFIWTQMYPESTTFITVNINPPLKQRIILFIHQSISRNGKIV